MEYSTEQAWDILTEQFNVSEETLRIVTSINGYSLETLESVLYAIAGFNDFEQIEEEE